jgi:hypothetical protein
MPRLNVTPQILYDKDRLMLELQMLEVERKKLEM